LFQCEVGMSVTATLFEDRFLRGVAFPVVADACATECAVIVGLFFPHSYPLGPLKLPARDAGCDSYPVLV